MADTVLPGKWTYRSFHNRAALVNGNAQAALDLIFAEAVFTFALEGATGLNVRGTLDWQGGGLDIAGTVKVATAAAPLTVELIGTGRPNSPTAGWEYDYRANLAYHWPHGVDQVAALVGTVIRAKPHDGEPAGYVASFIAVKQ
jgi:hypothetical protein